MFHFQRLFVLFTSVCVGLSACATAAPISTVTASPIPTSTFTPTPPPLTATPTLQSTATPQLTSTPEPIVIKQTTVELPTNADLLISNGHEGKDSETFLAFRQERPDNASPEDTKKAKLDLVNIVFNYIYKDHVALGELRGWLTSSITKAQSEILYAPFFVPGAPYIENDTRAAIISPLGNTAESNKIYIQQLDVKNEFVDGSFIFYRRYDKSFGVIYVDLKAANIRELAPLFELETGEIVNGEVTPLPTPFPSPTPIPTSTAFPTP